MSKKKKTNKTIKKYLKFTYILPLIALLVAIILGTPGFINYLEEYEPIDMTGRWELTFHITDSSYQDYIEMNTAYRIYIQQHDQLINGLGEKWRVNSDDLDYSMHDPISFEGSIDKYDLNVTYTLNGETRTTYGEIKTKVYKDGKFMEGKFSGTGADVNGLVYGFKID